jgi:NAD(P)-dependent dehydrogenase (short-subunit alcohol dehydrogenase family)
LENSTDHLISHLPDLKFDIVINNAGVNAIRPFEQLTHAFVEAIMRVNFLAPVLLVQQLMARELLQRPAVICNITSDAAWRPMRHSLAYNCSKAAFDMATKQMARELTKPNDMTIFSVAPGKMTGTGMSQYIDAQVCKLRGWTPEEAAQYAANSTVTGKEFLPSSVAKVIYMLCTHGLPISGTRIDLAG